MIVNLSDTMRGPNLTWATSGNIQGSSYSLTYEDITTETGAVSKTPVSPTTGQQYNNLASVTPLKRGMGIAKWVLDNTTYGFYGAVFISETDLTSRIVTGLSLSSMATNALLVKTYNEIRSILSSISCVYLELTAFGASLFDEALYNYIIASSSFTNAQQIQELTSDGDKIRYFENKAFPFLVLAPIDEFINAILAIPEIAALNTEEEQSFALSGYRRTEATLLGNRDGTTNVTPLQKEELF